MSKFALFKNSISFPESADRYYVMMQERREAMAAAEKEFVTFYKSKSGIRAVLEHYMEFTRQVTKKYALDVLYKKLPECEIYDLTAEAFNKSCWNLDEADEAYGPVVDAYNEIEEELELEKEYRSERKDSRGRFVGGGFGMGGAIKGAATAGALNMATGLGHSVFNAIGNLGSELAASNAKDQLYASKDTIETLRVGVVFSIWDIYDEYMELVNSYYENDYYIYCYEEDKAKALFQNAKDIPGKREMLLVEALRACPYYFDLLTYVFENYPEERQNACEIADFYGLDLSDSFENVFKDYCKKTDQSDGESILATRDRIISDMKAYKIKDSETLDKLDKAYLTFVFEAHYKRMLPGDRTQATELIQGFQTKKSIKTDFIKKKEIWELAKENGVTFTKEQQKKLVYQVYSKLREQHTAEEKTAAVLDALFVAVDKGSFSEKEKEEFLLLLSDANKNEKIVCDQAIRKKEDILKGIIEDIESTVKLYDIASRPFLDYRKGEGNKNADKLNYAKLEPGEYVLMIYRMSLSSENGYASGFAVTERRLICSYRGGFEITIDSKPVFSGGGFFSSNIKCTIDGTEHSLDVDNLGGKKHFAECLNKTFSALRYKQTALNRITLELKENIAEQKMISVKNSPFLVQYLGIKDRADKIISEGEAAIEQREERNIQEQIQGILESCAKTPQSVVAVWKKLVNSPYEEDRYRYALDELGGYLHDAVYAAEKLETLTDILQSREEILQLSKHPKIEVLDEAVAEKAKQIKRNHIEKMVSDCRQDCPDTIAQVWVKLCNCNYEKELYILQLDELCAMLLKMAENADSVAFLEEVEAARQVIAPYDEASQMQQIKQAVEGRRGEAQRMDEVRRQKNLVADIRETCDTNNLKSIMSTWESFANSNCEEVYFKAYLEELGAAILRMLFSSNDIPSVTAIREMLANDNAERYQMYIQRADEKTQKLDVAQRTYKDVLFDSVEDIAYAQEEEKRLDIIMRMVAKDDPASVDNAIQQVSESKSNIKQIYLKTLFGYQESNNAQQRTFRNVVYDTVEQAEVARSAYITARQISDQLDFGNEQEVLRAYESISALNHVQTEEFLVRIRNQLDVFDTQKRTVQGILFETVEQADTARKEHAQIQSIMAELNTEDEQMLLRAREQISACTTEIKTAYLLRLEEWLTQYDIKMRTFREKLYDNREIVVTLRMEEAAIKDIMMTVREDDENTLLSAKQSLESLSTFLKNVPLNTINRLLTEYDVKVRTVEGVLYNTREEAASVAAEIRHAEEIMSAVSPDDELSILEAQKAILQLTTGVRDVKYAQLNQMWEVYDIKVRTFENILFETRGQAQIAQQTYTEFLGMVNTWNLSERLSVTNLRNYVEDHIPEQLKPQAMKTVDDIRLVLDGIDYVVQRDREIDLAIHKKESAELHKYIECLLPGMIRYRMDTTQIQALKDKHFASLNVAKKLFSFIKSKM